MPGSALGRGGGPGGGGGGSAALGRGGGRNVPEGVRDVRDLPSIGEDDGYSLSEFRRNLARSAGDMAMVLPRAVFSMVSAPVRDIYNTGANVGRAASGRDTEWESRTWDDVIRPWFTESIPDTVGLLSEVTFAPAAAWHSLQEGSVADGIDETLSRLRQRGDDFYHDPVGQSLEHVGNVAIMGSIASRPVGMAASARAGHTRGAQGSIAAAKREASMANRRAKQMGQARVASRRQARRDALHAIRETGGPGSNLATTSLHLQNIIGHPYQTAMRKAAHMPIPGLGGRLADGTAQGPFRAAGTRVTGAGGMAGASAAYLADMGLTGGALTAALGGAGAALAYTARTGGQPTSVARLVKDARNKTNPNAETGWRSPTAERIRQDLDNFNQSDIGTKLRHSKIGASGRAVSRAAARTNQEIREKRRDFAERWEPMKAETRILRGITQQRDKLRNAGIELPDRRYGSLQRALENDPNAVGRILDEADRVGIDLPGIEGLDKSLVRVRLLERTQGVEPGTYQRLVTRKAQMDSLLETQSGVLEAARTHGRRRGMSDAEIEMQLRQSLDEQFLLPEEMTTYHQMDRGTRAYIDNAATEWRRWQRAQEPEIAQQGLTAEENLAVRSYEARPTQRVVRDGEGNIRLDIEPEALDISGPRKGGAQSQPSPRTSSAPQADMRSGAVDWDLTESMMRPPQGEPNTVFRHTDPSDPNAAVWVHADAQGNPGALLSIENPQSGQVTVVTRPDLRRQGYARRLVEQAEAEGFNVSELAGQSWMTPEGAGMLEGMRQRQQTQEQLATDVEGWRVDDVPQEVVDAHREFQRLRDDPATTSEQLEAARARLAEQESIWDADRAGNVRYEALDANELPDVKRLKPSEQQQRVIKDRNRRVRQAEKNLERAQEQVRQRRSAHQADALDRYNRMYKEMRNLEKQAMKHDPTTAEGRAAWDRYHEMFERLDQFEAEMELAAVGGRPRAMRETAEQLQSEIDQLIHYARNLDEASAPTPDSYQRFERALEELEEFQNLIPEIGPTLAMVGREQVIPGPSREARALLNLAKTNRRMMYQPEWQQAMSIAVQQPNVRRYRSLVSPGQQQQIHGRLVGRAERALEQVEPTYSFERGVGRIESLVERYREHSRQFEQKLTKSQLKAREQLRNLRRKEQALENAVRRRDEYVERVNQSIDVAPRPMRPALKFARQAQQMEEVLLRDFGVPEDVVRALELENLPQTLEQLHQAGVNPTYVHVMEQEFGLTPRTGRARDLRRTVASRFKRARQSGQIFMEDLPHIVIPATQIQMFRQVQMNNIVRWIEDAFGKTPEQVMKEGGIPQERINQVMREAKGKRERVLEDGTVVPGRKPQHHVLEAEMRKLGHAAYNSQDFQGLRDWSSRPDVDLWVPETFGKLFSEAFETGRIERFLQGTYDPAMGVWKAGVLALRPAWQVYNITGMITMSLMGGRVSPRDMLPFLRQAFEARRRYGRGEYDQMPGVSRQLADELFDTGTSMGEYRRDISALGDAGRTFENWLVRNTAVGQKIQDSPIGQTGMRYFRKAQEELGRTVEASFRFNNFFDHLFRATVYYSRLSEGSSPSAAVRYAKRTIGDYRNMTPFERATVRRMFPFYAWIRHISQLSARQLGPDHINNFVMYAGVAQVLGEPNHYEEKLPAWGRGDIHVGYSDEGHPMFIGTRGINPYTDALDPIIFGGDFSLRGMQRNFNPLVQMALENQTGIDSMTMRPFSRPYPILNEQGQEIPSAPPLGQQLVNTLPQARFVQNVWRRATGDTLSRYGTGEPIVIPGATEPSLVGQGAQLLGASVRPIDVHALEERRENAFDAAVRQRQRYEEERAVHEQQRQAQSLPSRLLP